MTDECYYIEEISPNLSEVESDKSDNMKVKELDDKYDVNNKKSQEIRLHEIEQQLEMAESRCNTLKGQVDYMKTLYNGMNKDGKPIKNTKVSQPVAKRHLTIDANVGKRKRTEAESGSGKIKDLKFSSTRQEEMPSRDVELSHQTMSNVSTVPHRDRDASAAVKSINNIISGITNSVNRLTQLQIHIGSSSTSPTPNDPIGIQNVKCSPRFSGNQIATAEKPYNELKSKEANKSAESIKSKPCKKKRKLKSKRSFTQHESIASVNDVKKRIKVTAKHTEKKTKLNQSSTVADCSQLTVGKIRKKQFGKIHAISSRTLILKKSLNSNSKTLYKQENQEWKSDKLIELYHNSAAKIKTASEDSIPAKNSTQFKKLVASETREKMLQQSSQQTVEINNFEKEEHVINLQQQYKARLSPIDEQGRVYNRNCNRRNNYELPTIASKMKQVARNYLDQFNYKLIPFVAAKSITPSHNLGVNIQQVLSIMKGRKPMMEGISPTLAYNIELAANKLCSRPLSALVTTLGSRVHNNKIMCPMSYKYPNFSHLQEMAKEIPEETVEELAANFEEEAVEIPPAVALGAGDKDIQENKWYTESKKKSEKCTCVPKQGLSFHDVYNKYSSEARVRNKEVRNPLTKIRYRPWNASRKVREIIDEPQIYNPSKSSQINKREKSLKEVLKNLHDEFANLNERYDELKNEVNNAKENKSNSTIVLEIEKMERDLQNKEDEITMVMSLYKEVLSLKQQVKVLKKRASQSTVVVSPFVNRTRDYKDKHIAGHLTKLLRHIQQFHESLKHKSNI